MRHAAALLVVLASCSREAEHDRAPRPSPSSPAAASSQAIAPAWVDVATVDRCVLREMRPPAGEASGLTWSTCPGGVAGCLEVGSSLLSGPFAVKPRVTAAATARGTMTMVRVGPLPGGRQRFVIGPMGGPATLLLEAKCTVPSRTGADQPWSQTGSFGVSESDAWLEIASTRRVDYFAFPLAGDGPRSQPVAVLERSLLGETIVDEPPAFASGALRAVDARGRLLMAEPAASSVKARSAGSKAQGSLRRVVARGPVALVTVATIPERILAWSSDHEPSIVRAARPASGMSGLAVDGAQVYWLEGRGRDPRNRFQAIDLWTAPFPRHVAPIEGRRVVATRARLMSDPVAGADHVAFKVFAGEERAVVDVVDARTSRTVRFVPPEGKVVAQLVSVDAQELCLEVVDRADPASNAPLSTWRLALRGLPELR